MTYDYWRTVNEDPENNLKAAGFLFRILKVTAHYAATSAHRAFRPTTKNDGGPLDPAVVGPHVLTR